MRLLILTLLIFILDNCETKSKNSDLELNLGLLAYRGNRISLSGSAVKGLIKKGEVNVYPLNSEGTCDQTKSLAKTTTNESGFYSLSYNKSGSVVCVMVTKNKEGTTTMFDENTGKDIPVSSSKFQLTNLIRESKVTNGFKTGSHLSPFSRILARRVSALAKKTTNPNFDSLTQKASKEIVIRFGLSTGFNSRNLKESDYPEMDDLLIELEKPNSAISKKFMTILVGFARLANKYKKGTELTDEDLDAIIDAFAEDMADGIFDGKGPDGVSITIGPNKVPLGNNSLTNTLFVAIQEFIQSGRPITVGGASVTVSTSELTQISFQDSIQIISSENSTSATVASSLTYPLSSYNFPLSLPVSLSPSSIGFTSCNVTPALPAGLSISSGCIISGTPSAIQFSVNYTITGTSSGQSFSTTIAIGIGDYIANSLTTSLASYTIAAPDSLVKVTQTEYNTVVANLSGVLTGFNGTIDNNWATNVAVNQTYTYNSGFVHANTVTTFPNSNYVFAFTFVPSLNPANSFTCQLKYRSGNVLTNLTSVYSGATIAIQDRQYFVIKAPTIRIPSSGTNYLGLFTSSGIGTTALVIHDYDYTTGNTVGTQSFTTLGVANTQYPTLRANSTPNKAW
ncbi:MAG: hypothetical protein SFU98_22160 [Leptospiraceae bacterium]|nr:hypothetical protein [Leptospiraceae bacterium]